MNSSNNISRRDFLKLMGVGAAAAATAPLSGCLDIDEPDTSNSTSAPIRWKIQTYAGSALGRHVIKPAIDSFNRIAAGRMHIDLFYADQLVPNEKLFAAVADGTVDAVQSDGNSMDSPADVRQFGGFFPFAVQNSLDVPALFHHWGLGKIWAESYREASGGRVTWLSAGAWDPCCFATRRPLRRLADLQGLRVFTFPTMGRFLAQFGVQAVNMPYDECELALRTGELDGVAWSGITEDYTVGWADATKYFLTNTLSGAWIGSFSANTESWNAVPPDLQELFRLCMDASHYYRQHWYWDGEARLRVEGQKLELTTIPESEWATVRERAVKFWDEIAGESKRAAKVIAILREYNDLMGHAGPPYSHLAHRAAKTTPIS